jgi:glycosyltransferase involved in cell wall biosynthesis
LHIQKANGISGSERHLLDLLPALAGRGVDVAMAVLVDPGGEVFAEAMRERGVDAWMMPAGPDLNPLAAWRLGTELRRRPPDLVHTHLIHADLHGQVAARLTGVPAVSSVHSSHPWYVRQPYRSAASVAGRLARRTIAISHHVGRMLIEGGIVPPDRVRVVHYGITVEKWVSTETERRDVRRELGLGDGEVGIGIAARLFPEKGHDSLIRAVALARQRDHPLRLLIAGNGPLQNELETLAKAEGLAEAATFLGFVSDIRRFMAGCDVVAFPTTPRFGEGFGLTALEAQAAGRPVIATRVASLPEVVSDGETGLLVDAESDEALAHGLMILAADASLRERLGASGRKRAARDFSLDAMIDGTLAVYEEALGKGAPRSRGA